MPNPDRCIVVHCGFCDASATKKIYPCGCVRVVGRTCECVDSRFPAMENECGQGGDIAEHLALHKQIR